MLICCCSGLRLPRPSLPAVLLSIAFGDRLRTVRASKLCTTSFASRASLPAGRGAGLSSARTTPAS